MAKAEVEITRVGPAAKKRATTANVYEIEHGLAFKDRPEMYLTDTDIGEFLTELEDMHMQHRLLGHALDAALPNNFEERTETQMVLSEDADALRWGAEELGWQIRKLRSKFGELLSEKRISHSPKADRPSLSALSAGR